MLGSLFIPLENKFVSHKTNILLSTACYLIIFITICIIRDEKLLPLVFGLLLIQGIFCNFVYISSLIIIEEVVSNDLKSICRSACVNGYIFCGITFSCIF